MDSIVTQWLSNYLNDFIARDQGRKSKFLELDTHDWSELIEIY